MLTSTINPYPESNEATENENERCNASQPSSSKRFQHSRRKTRSEDLDILSHAQGQLRSHLLPLGTAQHQHQQQYAYQPQHQHQHQHQHRFSQHDSSQYQQSTSPPLRSDLHAQPPFSPQQQPHQQHHHPRRSHDHFPRPHSAHSNTPAAAHSNPHNAAAAVTAVPGGNRTHSPPLEAVAGSREDDDLVDEDTVIESIETDPIYPSSASPQSRSRHGSHQMRGSCDEAYGGRGGEGDGVARGVGGKGKGYGYGYGGGVAQVQRESWVRRAGLKRASGDLGAGSEDEKGAGKKGRLKG
ncbi:hypothetical protein E8E13_002129 [Curvularia kusanoi]|uniref:Uncharacterized protein n=1 Tax=Curvularia kusanoi TaxID=90978 RepID=A0A9P4WAF9_CURKU|nr:hypothetical protein E8E13_002129 [Curvularia kusanoi]